MFLHWRANLADQNKQQPLKINIRVTYHTVLSVWNKPLIDTCQHCSTSRANQALRSLANAGFQNRGVCLQAFPSFPSSFPHFHFLALVSFLARPKPRIPFHGLSLLRNQTEMLATQATEMRTLWHNELVSSILFLWHKEVTQIIQKSPRTINTSLFGEGGGGKEFVAILTALSKFARKTFLRMNWSVKTPWLERMEFARSGLWAPG